MAVLAGMTAGAVLTWPLENTHQRLAHCAEGLVKAVVGCLDLSYVLQQAVGATHLLLGRWW